MPDVTNARICFDETYVHNSLVIKMEFEHHPFQFHLLTVNFRMLEHPSKVLAEALEFFNFKSCDNNKNK